MKKMVLLFTIVCAGQLYGMEQQEEERRAALLYVLRQKVEWSGDTQGLFGESGVEGLKKFLAEHPGVAKNAPQILFKALNDAKQNTVAVIELLLDNGANPYAQDDLGRTFVDRVDQQVQREQQYPTGSTKWIKIKELLERGG